MRTGSFTTAGLLLAMSCSNGAGGGAGGASASGRAGSLASVEKLLAKGVKTITSESIHAVTVPGAVEAWAAILERHGSYGLDRALGPAIRHAERGFPVAPRVAYDWTQQEARLKADPGAALHALPGGRAPATGDVVRFPALAATLRTIFAKLGLTELMDAKTVYSDSAAHAVADKKAELGFTQISEILNVPGAVFAAPLPPEVQVYTTFAAASYTPGNAGVSPASSKPLPRADSSMTRSTYAGVWKYSSSSRVACLADLRTRLAATGDCSNSARNASSGRRLPASTIR